MDKWMKAIVAIALATMMLLSVGCTPEIWDPVDTEETAPEGAVAGLFSVSETQQVWFSQGNLQYIGSASTPYWKFAENQWSYLGSTTGQDSDNPNADRDLFGWGTSGYYSGGTYYMPFDVAYGTTANYDYGPKNHGLTEEYANTDWGVYNAISNGGNTAGQWRTLLSVEWNYLMTTRNTTSGIRFAKGVVNGVNGIILLPDKWTENTYTLMSTNDQKADYNSNIISLDDWNSILEPKGVVFLPSAGLRKGTTIEDLGSNGQYWTASFSYSGNAYAVVGNYSVYYESPRSYGMSVRLVQDNHSKWPIVKTTPIINVAQTTAQGGGNVTYIGGSAVTEQGVCWSTSHNPTISDDYAPSSTVGEGAYSVEMTGLTPNTTYYVRAYAINSKGTSYGNEVAFATLPEVAAPEGAVNGLFSISATQQVWFSKGNLQYIGSATPPYWKFAECQWDRFGVSTLQDSDNRYADRDLFGWGTSGYYSGGTYYMPFDVAYGTTANYDYGPNNHDLTDNYAESDWGIYNAISNGGNTAGQWRTLSKTEWNYVMIDRHTSSDARFAKAVVNDVNGIILLPDNWIENTFVLASINDSKASFNSNIISDTDWISALEPNGAVFLPTSGLRKGTTLEDFDVKGLYWTSTFSYSGNAYGFVLSDSGFGYYGGCSENPRSNGGCVRLVQEY